MIGHAILWEIVSPNFLFSATGANQASPVGRILFRFRELFFLEQSGTKNSQGLLLILLLAATILTSDDLTGGNMEDLYRRVCRVHSLAARASRPAHFDANILGLDFNINFLGFRENSHSRSRGVNSALCFRHWYPLHTVNTALVPQYSKN